MNKQTRISTIATVIIVLLLVTGGLLTARIFLGGDEDTWICENGQWIKHGSPSAPMPSTPCATEAIKQQEQVPLPTEEDVIRNFFSLINERKIPEAISSMSKNMASDDSVKQAWGVQFNAIKSINVQKIEPSMPESWNENRHVYKVTLEAYVSSDAANAPIPYYGWGDNPNIRWVSITKEGGLWKIDEIATGP